MSNPDDFVGFWKILNCAPVAISVDLTGVKGVSFQLTKTGDVIWKIPDGTTFIPLFRCDTYEIVTKKPCIPNIMLRFGTYKGHILDCTVKTFASHVGAMSLSDGCCMLVCKKYEEAQQNPLDLPFSFLPALQDGYFSDLTIKASNNKEFHVHTCILKLTTPKINWMCKPTPFSNLPEDVIRAILHYLYGQCLPKGLEENTLSLVMSAASQYEGLDSLVSIANLYLKNLTSKKQINNLLLDMHAITSQIIENFSNKNSAENVGSKRLCSEPARLSCAVKNSIRDFVTMISRFFLLSDVYCRHKNEFSKEEKREIIILIKSRVPIFISQFQKLIQIFRVTFHNVRPSEYQEMANYLIPEIDSMMDFILSLMAKMKTNLEVLLTDSEIKEDTISLQDSENLEQFADNLFQRKEVGRLRCLVLRLTCILVHFHQKKESFKVMNNGNKIRSIIKNLEEVIDDLPVAFYRADVISNYVLKKSQKTDSSFLFKIITSKLREIIKKMVVYKDSFKDLFLELCNVIQREKFSMSLLALGILEKSNGSIQQEPETNEIEETIQNSSKPVNQMQKDFIFTSPPASLNCLSKAASQLLKSGEGTDMVFEIVTSGECHSIADNTKESDVEKFSEANSQPEICEIPAHRVIIAARCDWFRRALLSGMQEDIQRKIKVHNVSPQLFSLFLEYLYTGQLNILSLTADLTSELLLLSDRYELDSLKQVCESGLKRNIDEDSVLYFLSMADRFNAKILKHSCEQFIVQHPDVMNSELFEELPDKIQAEIYEAVICDKPEMIDFPLSNLLPTPSYSMSDLEEMAAKIHIDSDSPSPECDDDDDDLPIPFHCGRNSTQNCPRLQAAIDQVLSIVGPEIPRCQLIQVILAADFDVNRAVNFFYSSQ